MNSGHQASVQYSLPPWSESQDTSGSLAWDGRRGFLDRDSISTASLNSTGTRLPRYSVLGGQQSIFDQEAYTGTLRDEEVYAHGETTSSERTVNGDTTALAEGPPLADNSNTRASALPPRYSSSFTPPRYSGVFGIPVQLVTAEGVSRTEHTYNICSGLKNKPWAMLRVFSQPPPGDSQKSQKFPHFSGGDMIEGLIEFTLDSPQTVNSITISLRGCVIKGSLAGDSQTFLDHQFSIWARASGDPRFPHPGSTKKFDGKLQGTYQFPFAFPFPTHVDISTSAAFSLPLQIPSDLNGTSSIGSSSPPSATVSPSTSSPLAPAATPRTSRFRSFGTAVNTGFSSGSNHAAFTHASTNHQFTSTHISRLSMESIPSSTGGRRKQSFNQERHQNEGSLFPVPKAPEESEKARLRRAAEERNRAQAHLQGNSSMSLPAHVYPTPQTFLERGIHANVQYELGLHITHGVLRTASKLKTAIIFTPSLAPPPASVARQLAYTEGASLPGTATDPNGWQTLPKVKVSGELLGRRKVEVECTLSLAKPLCYTRGTVIPCYLTLESSNSHALGLLSSPKSPFVRLTRRVRYSRDASSTVDDISTNVSSLGFHDICPVVPSADRFSGSSRGGGRHVNMDNGGKLGSVIQKDDEVGLAVWWIPLKDAPQEMYLKRIEGEIHLAKNLQPTCLFLPFSVEYAVEMLPLASHAFEPARSQCLLIQPVEIATHHSKEGPMPTAFTEPRSDREREKGKERETETDQVEIVGFL